MVLTDASIYHLKAMGYETSMKAQDLNTAEEAAMCDGIRTIHGRDHGTVPICDIFERFLMQLCLRKKAIEPPFCLLVAQENLLLQTLDSCT
jgi:hypothetical protein